MNKIRKILITGAGSGLGEGTAIGLAKSGHEVIATAQTWPQVTALRAKAAKLVSECIPEFCRRPTENPPDRNV